MPKLAEVASTERTRPIPSGAAVRFTACTNEVHLSEPQVGSFDSIFALLACSVASSIEIALAGFRCSGVGHRCALAVRRKKRFGLQPWWSSWIQLEAEIRATSLTLMIRQIGSDDETDGESIRHKIVRQRTTLIAIAATDCRHLRVSLHHVLPSRVCRT